MPPDIDVKDSQADQGDKSGQDETVKDDKNQDNKDVTAVVDDKKSSDQFVTPTALQGVMDAHKRSTDEAQKKSDGNVAALQNQIEELTKVLAGKKDSDKDNDEKNKVDPELAELRRQVEQQTKLLEAEKQSRAIAEAKEKSFRFENTVKAALIAANCEMPDAAFLVIKPLLKEKSDGSLFSTVKISDGNLETDLDLKTFIEREFSEVILPHVFKGKMRVGSPASGDPGDVVSGSYDCTWDQIQDPQWYADNTDKARKALENKRVKGMPTQSAGAI